MSKVKLTKIKANTVDFWYRGFRIEADFLGNYHAFGPNGEKIFRSREYSDALDRIKKDVDDLS